MTRFAEGTEVDPEKSRQELMRTLERYGASHFVEARAPSELRYAIEFQLRGRWYRFKIEGKPIETFYDAARGRQSWASLQRILQEPSWYKSELAAMEKRRRAEWRRQWRVLINHTKMLMDMALDEDQDDVAGGAAQDDLLPYLLLPTHETFAEHYAPQVDHMYLTGQQPDDLVKLLPAPGGR